MKNKKLGIVCGIIILIGLSILTQTVYADQQEDQPGKVLSGKLNKPEFFEIKYLDKLPDVSTEEKKRREDALEKTHKSPQPKRLPKQDDIISGDQKSDVFPVNISDALPTDGSINIYKNSTVPISSGWKSSVNEPSLGSYNGKYIFYTGNWYAARSINGGDTFSFVSPYADMFDFCCDQEVIYDPSRNIFLWYRQGVADATGENIFRLGVSNDNGANWFFYNVAPSDVNPSWAGWEWDYPQVTLSNNYLYIATNLFLGDIDAKTVMLRLPLDNLKDNVAIDFSYYYENYPLFTFTPVQGSTDTMYWAVHNNWDSPTTFRIYKWPEAGTVSFVDRTLPHSWPATYRGGSFCPGPDSNNWCWFTDQRITGGWNMNGVLGFYWNVRNNPGLSYPNPYIEAATFRESDLSVIGMPSLWDSSYAVQYGFASPDPKGDLGIALFYGGGSRYPTYAIGVSDDINAFTPKFHTVIASTNGPSNQRWGDYIRVRPLGNRIWYASGFSLQGGSTGAFTEPRYLVFGRKIDNLNVFVRGTDNTLWQRSWNGGAWSGWSSLGGLANSDPDAVSRGKDSIDVFVRGTDNALWQKTWNGVSWSGWQGLGGVLTSGPSVASTKPNNLYVFARGNDNALWYKKWNGVSWSSWQSLGGVLTSDPDAISRSIDNIDVLVRGIDNSIWRKTWNGVSWSGWQSLGGTVTTGPTGISSKLDVLNIFAVGTDSGLWQRQYDGVSWGGWSGLGGILTSNPDAASWGLDNMAIFGRGVDNALWYRSWNGASWNGWQSLGGTITSGPGISSWG